MIVEKITKYLEESQEEVSIARDFFRASEAGSCPRAIYYSRKGEAREPFDAKTLMIFEDGRTAHWSIRDKMIKAGLDVSWIEKELEKEIEGIKIKGHIDGGFFLNEKQKYIFEIKTLNQFAYKRILKEGMRQSKASYYCQFQLYLFLTGVEIGIAIYKNKDKAELSEELIIYEEQVVKEILKRFKSIEKALEDNIPPEAEPLEDWQCNYCSFSQCSNYKKEKRKDIK